MKENDNLQRLAGFLRVETGEVLEILAKPEMQGGKVYKNIQWMLSQPLDN